MIFVNQIRKPAAYAEAMNSPQVGYVPETRTHGHQQQGWVVFLVGLLLPLNALKSLVERISKALLRSEPNIF